jgi:hypothetical protein
MAPLVSVHIATDQPSPPVLATIVSRGSLIELGRRRLEKTGDTATTATPIEATADFAAGGLDVVGPADGTWIKVELARPREAPTMTASASAVRITFTNGRLWMRGIPRSEALAR